MSWRLVHDPALGECHRAPSGARCVAPLDGVALAETLVGVAGRLRSRVGQPVADETEPGEIWIDLTAFSGVGPVDPVGQIVRAGGGATWGAIEARLQVDGLTLGPVPGWLWDQPVAHTLDGGRRARPSPACGELLDLVMAIQAVLPGGGLTRSAVSPRRATGPDLARGVVGAEGRAGVVLGVHVQAWPLAGQVGYRATRFGGWAEALAAGQAVLRAGARPQWWRFAPAPTGEVVLTARFGDLAGLDHCLARYDEAAGGRPDDPGAAEALDAACYGPGAIRRVAPTPRWVGAPSAAVGQAEATADAEVWDLRPEGVTVCGAGAPPAAQASGWEALAAAAFAALEPAR